MVDGQHKINSVVLSEISFFLSPNALVELYFLSFAYLLWFSILCFYEFGVCECFLWFSFFFNTGVCFFVILFCFNFPVYFLKKEKEGMGLGGYGEDLEGDEKGKL